MKVILLNGAKMRDRESAHDYLKRKLSLPDYYGNNLDALWDCLTADFSPKKIIIYNLDKLIETPDSYGESIISLLQEAARDNEYIEVKILK